VTRLRSERGKFRLAVMLLLPAITALLLIYYLPIVQSAVLSSFDLRFSLSLTSDAFSGFKNYGSAPSNTEFWQALRFTVGFALVAVSLDMSLGMLFALATFWVDRRFRNILRAIVIIPWAIPNVIQASIWRWLFNTDVGLIGDLLVRSVLSESAPLFLARPALAYVAVTCAYVWKGAVISSIFCMACMACMAGLATVPKEMQEAARSAPLPTKPVSALASTDLGLPAQLLALS